MTATCCQCFLTPCEHELQQKPHHCMAQKYASVLQFSNTSQMLSFIDISKFQENLTILTEMFQTKHRVAFLMRH